MHLYYTLAGFITLAAIAQCAEHIAEAGAHKAKSLRHGAILAGCCHPSVIRGLHDLGIYVVAEAPKLFALAH